jgi:hypothetical protein
MFAWNCSTIPTRIVGVLLIILTPACSGGGDRTPADTTSSAAAAAAVPDSANTVASGALPADTPTKTTDTATAVKAPTTGAAAAPATPKPRVRPSIDPGRKAPSPAAPAPSTPRSPDTAALAKPAQAPVQGSPVKYDASTNTATFDLIGGPNGFQFNGHASGSGTLTLPPKANVVMNFVNKDGTPHSAEVVSGEGPLPNAGVDAALPRAYTNQLLQGLPQEGSDVMRFQAPASGTFRIFCGVPGHGLSGMWIWMKVDPAAKTASFGPTKG